MSNARQHARSYIKTLAEDDPTQPPHTDRKQIYNRLYARSIRASCRHTGGGPFTSQKTWTRWQAPLSSKCSASLAVVPVGRMSRRDLERVCAYLMPLKSHSTRSICMDDHTMRRVL